ncbi:uncharacterized protein F5147DRAFT_652001 [Suillus discolor]|uniref:Uncharacterized protein n=1 Tax=Suillus discolor TaxID=1912936 RepID=A0A9P7JUV8_9AGAM|nr:uncharacterized protein F5147DRAFT_652001 [Suillus discolor]KAG2110390.1 hypothetical protein F5147DRAFT_652001 [Suillus discolor]
MSDNADYWVDAGGKVFTFKFPATLDLNSQYNWTGPYFNLPRTGLDLAALKKMWAQFELRPLDAMATDKYPMEAIKCSGNTLDMLNVLFGEVEEARNAFLDKNAYPKDVPFWCQYPHGENQCFTIIVMSIPLLEDIPDPSHASVPRLKRMDIGKSDMMHSPSNARAAAMAGGGSGNDGEGSTQMNGHQHLSDLPDPLGLYTGFIAQFNLCDTKIVAPDVLPDASITTTTFADLCKGKCKAIDEAGDSGPSKKPVHVDDAADSAGEEVHEEEEEEDDLYGSMEDPKHMMDIED